MLTRIVLGVVFSLALLPQNLRDCPTKPVRIIEPFGAGGGPDLTARALSPKLSELWGQPVTVENHTGGGSTAASALVAKSPADGYTLLVNTSAQAYSAATTISELIAAARAKPGELKFGSTGQSTGSHLGLLKFNLAAGIKAMHVPAQQGEESPKQSPI